MSKQCWGEMLLQEFIYPLIFIQSTWNTGNITKLLIHFSREVLKVLVLAIIRTRDYFFSAILDKRKIILIFLAANLEGKSNLFFLCDPKDCQKSASIIWSLVTSFLSFKHLMFKEVFCYAHQVLDLACIIQKAR